MSDIDFETSVKTKLGTLEKPSDFSSIISAKKKKHIMHYNKPKKMLILKNLIPPKIKHM